MILEICNRQKQFKTSDIRKIMKKAAVITLKKTEIGLQMKAVKIVPVFSVIITDNEDIRKLNSKYRGIEKETDVLSFPGIDSQGTVIKKVTDLDIFLENGKKMINFGDIVISAEKAMEQSVSLNQSFSREIFFLTVHSLLHLFGYDHIKKADEKLMIAKQKEIMEYADTYIL